MWSFGDSVQLLLETWYCFLRSGTGNVANGRCKLRGRKEFDGELTNRCKTVEVVAIVL